MNKKILLADDSITIQKVIELTFSDEDFDVITVGNGRAAMEKALDARPDIVLCDIIMPEKNGYEVCEFIKKNPLLSDVPVLLLTGAFEPFDQERATRVGCDGFLAKPFEPQTLITKVKDLLKQAAARPAPAPPPAAPPPPAPAWSAPAAPLEPPAPPAWSAPPPPFAAPAPASPGAPPARPTEPFSPGTPSDFAWSPAPPPPAPAPPSASPPPPPLVASAPAPAPEAAPPAPAETFFTDDGFPEDIGGGFAEMVAGGSGDETQVLAPRGNGSGDAEPVVESPEELVHVTPEEAESLAAPDDGAATLMFGAEASPWSEPPPPPPAESAAAATPAMPEPAMFEEVFEEEPPTLPEVPAVPFAAPPPEPVPPMPAWAPPPAPAALPEPEATVALPRPPEPLLPAEPIVAEPLAPTIAAFAPEPEPAAPAPAVEEAPEPVADLAREPLSPRAAEPAAGAGSDVAPSAPAPGAAGAAEVPAELVAEVTQRVVAQISERIIREVVWEVVPDLAEALIKKEIERLKQELQQT